MLRSKVAEKSTQQCKNDKARDGTESRESVGLGRRRWMVRVTLKAGHPYRRLKHAFFCPLPAGKAQGFSGQKFGLESKIQRGCAAVHTSRSLLGAPSSH